MPAIGLWDMCSCNRIKVIFLAALFLAITVDLFSQFKADQMRYQRVRTAYSEYENEVSELLEGKGLERESIRVYIRSFKDEGIMEVWARDAGHELYQRIFTFDICQKSGTIGPKRRQGDYQVPEGYYHIDRFNPSSSYYLSLGLNYPNKSDRVFSDKTRPGGDIFIHGECVTIGCMPMTNPLIKQIYLLCVEAREAGQKSIPVTVFPMKLSNTNYQALLSSKSNSEGDKNLWRDLKLGYDLFNTHKQLPSIDFLDNGRHTVSK
jgi:murein L,D-transpeptidase YafK